MILGSCSRFVWIIKLFNYISVETAVLKKEIEFLKNILQQKDKEIEWLRKRIEQTESDYS